jgi:hypothetical protein
MYISAYEATVQRSTNKLASVVNYGIDYRGGNNDSSLDASQKSLLGRPASSLDRSQFRTCARNRKTSSSEWNMYDYNVHKSLVWLYYVEYANRNSQLQVNNAKDESGFSRGGLGVGVSNFSGWSAYNSSIPFIPCGQTNVLGNGSGEVAYAIRQDDGSVVATVYANRYRGVENPFGHLWKWTDGILIIAGATADNGGNNATIVYVADNPIYYNDSDTNGYSARGSAARVEGFVKDLLIGEYGDIIPTSVGGNATSFWADYYYTTIPTKTTKRGLLLGGTANSGEKNGILYSGTHASYWATNTDIGTRLCFIPQNS